MFIPDPDFYPTRIADPTTATKEGRKNLLSYLFCSLKYHKIESYFIFEPPDRGSATLKSTLLNLKTSLGHGFYLSESVEFVRKKLGVLF
jgi:hypothetical protein